MSRNSSTAPWAPGRAGVGRVGREEGHRLVAPVVDEAGGRGQPVELVDGQQLDGGDAQVQQVRDLVDEARYVPRSSGATPELGWAVRPRTCAS